MNAVQRVSESVAIAHRLLNGDSYQAVAADSGITFIQVRYQAMRVLGIAAGDKRLKRGRIDDYRAESSLWHDRLNLVDAHAKTLTSPGMKELTAELLDLVRSDAPIGEPVLSNKATKTEWLTAVSMAKEALYSDDYRGIAERHGVPYGLSHGYINRVIALASKADPGDQTTRLADCKWLADLWLKRFKQIERWINANIKDD